MTGKTGFSWVGQRTACGCFLLLLIVVGTSACGSGGPPALVDGAVDVPVTQSDLNSEGAAEPGDVPADSAPDASTLDGRLPDTDPAAPPRRRLVEGTVALVGSGFNACSNQAAAAGDRWCAFARRPAASASVELWLMNASRAIAGADVKCDGTDSNCLHVGDDLAVDDLTMHGFIGDTLLFYVGNTGVAGFEGRVMAWRPGWTAARQLTSTDGLYCTASAGGGAAVCFQNATLTGDVWTADMLAGTLGDGQGGVLPVVDQIIFAVDGEPEQLSMWGVQFSVDGASLAWSTRAFATGKEILKTQKVNDAASRRTVAEDAARWSISRDGTRFFWLKEFNYSLTGADSGTLQVAAFPDGTGPATLMTSVADFVEFGPRGMILRAGVQDYAGDLKVIPDLADLAGATVMDTGVSYVWGLAADGQAALYSKTFGDMGIEDLYLRTLPAAVPCMLVGNSLVAGAAMSNRHSHVSWAELDPAGDNFDAFLASPTACLGHRFASGISRLDPIGEEGYVWQDDSQGDGEGTIRYGRFVNDDLPAGGTIVDTLAWSNYAILRGQAAIMYTVGGSGARAGLYLSTGLPFSTGK